MHGREVVVLGVSGLGCVAFSVQVLGPHSFLTEGSAAWAVALKYFFWITKKGGG